MNIWMRETPQQKILMQLFLVIGTVAACSTEYLYEDKSMPDKLPTLIPNASQDSDKVEPMPSKAEVKPKYRKDKLNDAKEVSKRMREKVYVFANDKQKNNPKLLPFFKITEAQKSILKARSTVAWNMVDYWQDVANDKHGVYPRLWELRPNRKLTGDAMFAKILALPTTSSSGAKFVKGQISSNSMEWYLRSERDDTVNVNGKTVGHATTDEWTYRGRAITPEGKLSPNLSALHWSIESWHPNFSWKFSESTHPTGEYLLKGDLRLTNRHVIYDKHPDVPRGSHLLEAWERPTYFGYLHIVSDDVFGSVPGRSGGLMKLNFIDALDVAINWIAAFEYAYGIEDK